MSRRLIGWLGVVAQLVLPAGLRAQDDRRPLYVIAHRVNDPGGITAALDAGANAIECDVRWGRPTIFASYDWYVDHDGVYAWSTTLNDWLAAAGRAASRYGDRFALIIWDIKTPERLASLHQRVRPRVPGVWMVFGVAAYANRSALSAIPLGALDGLSIDEDNDPGRVQSWFLGQGVGRFWYGNGTFVYGVGPNIEPSVRRAVQLRDEGQGIKKVYVWTLEAESSIELYFRDIHADGLFVNPGRVGVAARIARAHGRLATRSDPAFVVWRPPVVVAGGVPLGQTGPVGNRPLGASCSVFQQCAAGLSCQPGSQMCVAQAAVSPPVAPPLVAAPIIGRFGPAGIAGGQPFEDYCQQGVAAITVRAGWWIDGVQVQCAGGMTHPLRGGSGGAANVFTLEAGERITGVSGSYSGADGPYVYSIQIQTDRRTSPEYGNGGPNRGTQGFRYTVPAGYQFAGLNGSAGEFLHMLGLLYSPVAALGGK